MNAQIPAPPADVFTVFLGPTLTPYAVAPMDAGQPPTGNAAPAPASAAVASRWTVAAAAVKAKIAIAGGRHSRPSSSGSAPLSNSQVLSSTHTVAGGTTSTRTISADSIDHGMPDSRTHSHSSVGSPAVGSRLGSRVGNTAAALVDKLRTASGSMAAITSGRSGSSSGIIAHAVQDAAPTAFGTVLLTPQLCVMRNTAAKVLEEQQGLEDMLLQLLIHPPSSSKCNTDAHEQSPQPVRWDSALVRTATRKGILPEATPFLEEFRHSTASSHLRYMLEQIAKDDGLDDEVYDQYSNDDQQPSVDGDVAEIRNEKGGGLSHHHGDSVMVSSPKDTVGSRRFDQAIDRDEPARQLGRRMQQPKYVPHQRGAALDQRGERGSGVAATHVGGATRDQEGGSRDHSDEQKLRGGARHLGDDTLGQRGAVNDSAQIGQRVTGRDLGSAVSHSTETVLVGMRQSRLPPDADEEYVRMDWR